MLPPEIFGRTLSEEVSRRLWLVERRQDGRLRQAVIECRGGGARVITVTSGKSEMCQTLFNRVS